MLEGLKNIYEYLLNHSLERSPFTSTIYLLQDMGEGHPVQGNREIIQFMVIEKKRVLVSGVRHQLTNYSGLPVVTVHVHV